MRAALARFVREGVSGGFQQRERMGARAALVGGAS
jgi:hypothetical protein